LFPPEAVFSALQFLRLDLAKKKNVPDTLLKKPHTLRCACSSRFNALKRTPQLVEGSRALRLKLFEQRVIGARDF
jgi:hypothetical protein